MTRVRVESFTISLDGYGAGPNQDINNPLGIGGTDLHQWLFPTRTLQRALFGKDGGTTGVDDDFAARGFENVGAWILGRNMFSPLRGPWPDMNWKGWWGDNPPYHVPVFIMTHHARPPIEMEGDTTFHFVTGGIRDALERAREAAGGMDVRVGGGPNTIQQYLRESLIDELHIAIAPVLLGGGERLFEGVDLRALGYECVEFVASEKATHVVLRHQGRASDPMDTSGSSSRLDDKLGAGAARFEGPAGVWDTSLRRRRPNRAANRTRRFMASAWRAPARRAGCLQRWTSRKLGYRFRPGADTRA